VSIYTIFFTVNTDFWIVRMNIQ